MTYVYRYGFAGKGVTFYYWCTRVMKIVILLIFLKACENLICYNNNMNRLESGYEIY